MYFKEILGPPYTNYSKVYWFFPSHMLRTHFYKKTKTAQQLLSSFRLAGTPYLQLHALVL